LRAYEKLLRLAPNELVGLYESIERPADEWLARPAQQEQVKPANLAQWGLVVVLILAVIAIAMFLLPDSPDNAPEPEVLEVPVALALPDDADAGVDANADAIDEADAGLAVEFLPDADSAVAAADPFELAPVPVAPAATTRVAMVFAEDSWVEVADANGRLLVNVIAAGSQREFSGVAPFSFFLGNAKGVQLSFDGVPYSIPIWSIRDKTARFKMTAADILALKDSAE
jgi:cytoskeleton protein RodZ